MAVDEALRKKVRRRVVKTPRTAAEIGKPLGYSGRGVGKILSGLVKSGETRKVAGRPPKYTSNV